MNLSNLLVSFATFFYVAALCSYFLELSRDDQKEFSWGSLLIEVGFLIHTFHIFAQTFSKVHNGSDTFFLPVGSFAENANFFAWSLAFVYFSFVKRNTTEGFGLILSPLLLLFMIPSFFPSQPIAFNLPSTGTNYFYLHILSAFFGYASFALSFAAGVLYLAEDRVLKRKSQIHFYHKLVPLEALERFVFRTMFWGLVLLGMAIVTGSLWMKSAFQSYWTTDPKSLAAILTWGFYLTLVWLHEISAMKGKRVILISVWAFALVLFTFIGTSALKTGIHM